MRYTAPDKMEIIRLVEQSNLPAMRTLARLDIRRSTFYNWLKRFDEGGLDALSDRKPKPRIVWNKLAQNEQDMIIGLALEKLVPATKIWRRMYESEIQLATDALKFMKTEVEKRG